MGAADFSLPRTQGKTTFSESGSEHCPILSRPVKGFASGFAALDRTIQNQSLKIVPASGKKHNFLGVL
jgi:hypothetical protein|nr:MAG TPA: hypothetical protein [Caudoviricetes sp.]